MYIRKLKKPFKKINLSKLKFPVGLIYGHLVLPSSIVISAILISSTLFTVSNDISYAFQATKETSTIVSDNTTSISVGSLSAKGNSSSQIGMIEYSDFECPFCGQYFDQAGRQVMLDYVDTGKIQLFYRNLPLSIHPHARELADASVCANEQNKFWDYYNTIFQKVLDNKRIVPDGLVQTVGDSLGIDKSKYNDCINSKRLTNQVDSDLLDAQKKGFSGTPSFVIGKIQNGKIQNGTIITGAQAYALFKQAIDSYL